jgi:hypothetical protein
MLRRRALESPSRFTRQRRGLVRAVATCGALFADLPGVADDVFRDDLESGTFCAWSFPPTGFEVAANGLDDDCDGSIDEDPTSCDNLLPSSSADPLQYAAAINLCQSTTENGHDWGVISGSLTLADGASPPAASSRSIRTSFGSGILPAHGASMAVLSTGTAAAPGQTNPAHIAFQTGANTGTQSAAPADWLTANGGAFPNAPGCPDADGTTALNPMMLTLRVRVPGNARSFRLGANFLSSEYPEWVCSPYNDLFVVLLDSQFAEAPANPADKNLAVYLAPGGAYPVGANLAFGNTGLFTQCLNGPTGCASGAVPATMSTCVGTAGLTGSGMDVLNPPSDPPNPGWCGASNFSGGGTGWLVLRGNVVPGENLTLRFAIWDTSDGGYDSVVLLDDFQWSTQTAQPGATSN